MRYTSKYAIVCLIAIVTPFISVGKASAEIREIVDNFDGKKILLMQFDFSNRPETGAISGMQVSCGKAGDGHALGSLARFITGSSREERFGTQARIKIDGRITDEVMSTEKLDHGSAELAFMADDIFPRIQKAKEVVIRFESDEKNRDLTIPSDVLVEWKQFYQRCSQEGMLIKKKKKQTLVK